MRHIGNLPDESSALTFSDYLYVQGIENDVDENRDGSWSVWIHSEEQLKQGAAMLERYRANPHSPEFSTQASKAASQRQLKEQEDESFRKKMHGRDEIFAWYHRIGLLSGILIAACVVVYILYYVIGQDRVVQLLSIGRYDESAAKYAIFEEILSGEVWRLFTPMFLHFGPLHILFNMLWLKELGTAIERRQNMLFLGFLVLTTAATSNAAQYLMSGPWFGGMSGVVYGLFGYIWMKGKFDPTFGLHLTTQTVTWMIAFFFVCLTGAIGPVANTAHGAGLLTGMATGYISAMLAQHHS
jgi:GlpG protein